MMRILFVAAECAPFVKTGGLGDVAAALPKALMRADAEVKVLLPAYRDAVAGLDAGETVATFADLMGGPAEVRAVRAEGLDLLVLDAPHLFDRAGNPYVQGDGADWPDNHLRFGAFAEAAAALATGAIEGWRADVVHAHDWHAGLVPLYLRLMGADAPPAMMTIHNVMYQGLFPPECRHALGLPETGFTPEGYEFHGQVGFLKAGLVYAARIGTVSPTYAQELRTPSFGMGLEGLIAARGDAAVGILNGIDLDVWNPAADPAIAATYDFGTFEGRAANKAALNARFGLEDGEGPMACVISRLTEQKGLDLLIDALPAFVSDGGRLAVLGTGDPTLERAFAHAQDRYPGNVGVVLGYDEELAHQLQAGADAIVVPSRFEPCGLTQMYGLRYGCLPIAARTGGLADTVIDVDVFPDTGNGFVCEPGNGGSLGDALARAGKCYRQPDRWRSAVRRAMTTDVGWDASAAAYMETYRTMIAGPGVAA